VLALQKRLVRLGYWNGKSDGSYGQLTHQAVYALEKAAQLDRDGRRDARSGCCGGRSTSTAALPCTARTACRRARPRAPVDLAMDWILSHDKMPTRTRVWMY
jgi:peptidoglycan hydrolase-like protein with peptidoglycan-binding domain